VTTLRRAVAADAAALTRLRGLMHEAMGARPTPESVAATQAAFARRLGTDGFVAYVVEDAGRVVSCGVGWVEEHLPAPYQLDARRGHIASMSTEVAARRQGHARAVFEALMAWFAGQGIVRVDLRATEDGRSLYEEFGFRELGGAMMAWFAPGARAGLARS